LYETHPVQPQIEVTRNSFKLILPNMNTNTKNPDVTQQEQLVLDYITENGFITDDDIQELLHVKLTRTYALMKTMKEKGVIKVQGRGAEKKYVI